MDEASREGAQEQKAFQELYLSGAISIDTRNQAMEILDPHKNWALWLNRMFLIIGSTLILAGIIFFFAFNWQDIPDFAKFISIALLMSLCAGGAYFVGLNGLLGQVLLMAATVLIGVFIAVFGQVYQTGADSYVLFLNWALLSLPWMLISRSPYHVTLWIVIANFALFFFFNQGFWFLGAMIYPFYATLMNGVFLLLIGLLVRSFGSEWLEAWWLRALLLTVTLSFALFQTGTWFFDGSMPLFGLFTTLLPFVMTALYRYYFKDGWGYTISLLGSSATIIFFFIKLLFLDGELEAAGFFMMLLLTLGLFAVCIHLIREFIREEGWSHG